MNVGVVQASLRLSLALIHSVQVQAITTDSRALKPISYFWITSKGAEGKDNTSIESQFPVYYWNGTPATTNLWPISLPAPLD